MAALNEGADPFGTFESEVEGEFCKADCGPETELETVVGSVRESAPESARPAIDED